VARGKGAWARLALLKLGIGPPQLSTCCPGLFQPDACCILPTHALLVNGVVMPPRLPLGTHRALLPSTPTVRFRVRLHERFASGAASTPEIYDVVCVGGGPAGLSLLAGLKASPVTRGLKVALIEGQDLQKNRLPKNANVDSFSNRCSSLTPASVKNLQGARAMYRICEIPNC